MSRTCRQKTLKDKIKSPLRIDSRFKKYDLWYAMELFDKNLDDLEKIIEWNADHGIFLFRMSSDCAPHITNPNFTGTKVKSLAYPMEVFRKKLRRIGSRAIALGMRLTFHPGQFNILSSPKKRVVDNTMRELYFHARMMDLMSLDSNSIIIVHGGGIYDDKKAASRRWVKNFNKLPINVKRRLVIENDERLYSTEDVLEISKALRAFDKDSLSKDKKLIYKIPVVFDIFHYRCYEAVHPGEQKSIKALLPEIIKSFNGRKVKMHQSNQDPDGPLGKHSFLVTTLPPEIKNIKIPIDIMIEAKGKEQAVFSVYDSLVAKPSTKQRKRRTRQ